MREALEVDMQQGDNTEAEQGRLTMRWLTQPGRGHGTGAEGSWP